MVVNGDQLGSVGFQYLGVPYSKMDCQAFVEQCLRDCGLNRNLAGSNAWFREVRSHGWVGTPEECTSIYGGVPTGAFLFILKHDGGEPEKYKADGLGNASHIGICTGTTGEGAIHSSSSKGMVCESKFKGKTIPNGGWNRVGLWDSVDYINFSPQEPAPKPVPAPSHPLLRKGSKGSAVQELQRELIELGYDLSPWGADGDFGNKTRSAVIQFQTEHGLEIDGVVGPMTWAALDEASGHGTVPGDKIYYTVVIPHVTKSVADALTEQYPDVAVTEE